MTSAAQRVAGFLTGKIQAGGELADAWTRLEDLYSRRLWHQITVELESIFVHPSLSPNGLSEVYENFLKDFEDRINQLALVKLCLAVAAQKPDPADAIEFLTAIQTKVEGKKDFAATVCVTSAIAELHLRKGDTATSKTLLEKCLKDLDNLDGVTPVHAELFRIFADWHKVDGNFAEFYTNALRFLGCIDTDTLPVEERVRRAYDLGLAALLGNGIYNFGELLQHPVLEDLRDTEKQWLVDLLFAFNSGDIAKFESLQGQWSKQEDLAANAAALNEKIRLLCVMELVFKAPSKHRNLAFDVIAKEARVASDQVELLVMKALSLKLIKGSIDEVEQQANLTWVQPRVLQKQQLAAMQEKLREWQTTVRQTAGMMQTHRPELFVQ